MNSCAPVPGYRFAIALRFTNDGTASSFIFKALKRGTATEFSRELGETVFRGKTRRVACRSEFVTAEASGGVRVFPPDGPSIGGVGVDVMAEFAS